MSESDQARPSGHTALTEYDRANARVFFFQAIERDGKKVIEDLIDSSAQDWASRWFEGRDWAIRQGERTKGIWADSPKAQARLEFLSEAWEGAFPIRKTAVCGVLRLKSLGSPNL